MLTRPLAGGFVTEEKDSRSRSDEERSTERSPMQNSRQQDVQTRQRVSMSGSGRIWILLAAACVCVTRFARSPAAEAVDCAGAMSPSELVSSGTTCDGKTVVVRGYLLVGPESRGLWDTKEDIDRSNYMKACVTVSCPRKLRCIEGPARLVDVHGTYHAMRDDGEIILGACTDGFVDIKKVVDIR